MILNAAAVQRGLAHGSLYKTDAVDLADEKGKQLVRVLTILLGLCEKSHCCTSMRSESGETQRAMCFSMSGTAYQHIAEQEKVLPTRHDNLGPVCLYGSSCAACSIMPDFGSQVKKKTWSWINCVDVRAQHSAVGCRCLRQKPCVRRQALSARTAPLGSASRKTSRRHPAAPL